MMMSEERGNREKVRDGKRNREKAAEAPKKAVEE